MIRRCCIFYFVLQSERSLPMKERVFNPYLPRWEYIPDDEPHAFGDRVYVYGSHDRFNGALKYL